MRKVLYREQVNGGYSEMDNEGYFHEFTKVNDIVCAIIERKDGTIEVVYAYMVKFVDSPEAIDMEQRRYEIARDLYSTEQVATAKNAVFCADELIKALKGE